MLPGFPGKIFDGQVAKEGSVTVNAKKLYEIDDEGHEVHEVLF